MTGCQEDHGVPGGPSARAGPWTWPRREAVSPQGWWSKTDASSLFPCLPLLPRTMFVLAAVHRWRGVKARSRPGRPNRCWGLLPLWSCGVTGTWPAGAHSRAVESDGPGAGRWVSAVPAAKCGPGRTKGAQPRGGAAPAVEWRRRSKTQLFKDLDSGWWQKILEAGDGRPELALTR
jgi:hypothetical protein